MKCLLSFMFKLLVKVYYIECITKCFKVFSKLLQVAKKFFLAIFMVYWSFLNNRLSTASNSSKKRQKKNIIPFFK